MPSRRHRPKVIGGHKLDGQIVAAELEGEEHAGIKYVGKIVCHRSRINMP